MRIGEVCKKHKKIWMIPVILLVLLTIGTASVLCFRGKTGEKKGSFAQTDREGEEGFSDAGAVRASGVINTGITQENFEVENLDTKLEIEEIYVLPEQEITEGARILKLSEESVAKAGEELEKDLREAELAYRAGVIAYEQKKITAEYEYDSAVLAGEQAEEIYAETLKGLTEQAEQAREALEEAQEQIAEYESYVNDGSYSAWFKVDEYQAVYDENLKVLTEKLESWGIDWAEVTGTDRSNAGKETAGSGNTANPGTMPAATVSSSDAGGASRNQYISVLSALYDILEQNLQDLEQAKKDCEEAMANAPFELQTLKLKLPALKQALAEAEEACETQTLQAGLTRETTLANTAGAKSNYDTALEQAESEYENLKSAWEKAKENLELFENSVGDGFYYAADSGTILHIMAQEENYLSPDSTIFVYSNPDEMSVTVSVGQEDIASVSVGDAAVVIASDGETVQGEVTAVDPVTVSESRTNVTYSVTVTLSGDTGNLTSGESVTVMLGRSAE